MTRFVIYIFAASFLFAGAIAAQEQKTPDKSDTPKPNRQSSAPSDDKPTTDDKAKTSETCLLYTSPSPRDQRGSRMPSSA